MSESDQHQLSESGTAEPGESAESVDRVESGEPVESGDGSDPGNIGDGVDAEGSGDQLPEDLQPHLVDPEDYVFPNNNRRRVPGYLYLAIAVGLGLLVLVRGQGVFVNSGLLGAAAILAVVGIYSIVAGVNLNVDERDALVASIAEVGFPVGHASAQMGWRGLLSRPTWRVLLYSAEDPPDRRGFVLVDGVDGSVIDSFTEANPEDWSELVE